MDTEKLLGLGLEPVLTTSELAEYVGVQVQAIYDLRTDGRGPSGIRVGREIRYRISDVRRWLDSLHEPEPALGDHGAIFSGGASASADQHVWLDHNRQAWPWTV